MWGVNGKSSVGRSSKSMGSSNNSGNNGMDEFGMALSSPSTQYQYHHGGIGQSLLPGVGYGMALPPDDQKGQRRERRTLMEPEQPPNSQNESSTSTANRKAPPTTAQTKTTTITSRNVAPPPVAAIDFKRTIAMWTAQIDQPDEETLMTQHAQRTLLEIQHTTGKRSIIDDHHHHDPYSGTNRDADSSQGPRAANEGDSATLGDRDISSNTHQNDNLPSLTEARKNVSAILEHRIQKPIEPTLLSSSHGRRLRQPRIRQQPADIMMGLSNGSITHLDHRLVCCGCGVPLVSGKAVIVVVCPHCHGKYPNDRTSPLGRGKVAAVPLQKDWSC